MIELIYTSQVIADFNGDDMQELLGQARRYNAEFDITGLLFFGSNRFIQILEGPEHSVQELYKNIQSDRRHTDVTLLHEAEISQRSFGSWLMSYEPLSGNDMKKIKGLSNAIKASEALEIAQDKKKNYGAHLFAVLTGASLAS